MPKWNDLKEKIISLTIGKNQIIETIGSFDVANMTPEEMRVTIRTTFAKYSYYTGLRAEVKRALAKEETELDMWESERMAELMSDDDTRKLTEKAKKASMIADNKEDWTTFQTKIRTANYQADKLWALVNGYEMMIRMLMSVMSMMKTEMELTAIDDGRSVKGKGRYSDSEE